MNIRPVLIVALALLPSACTGEEPTSTYYGHVRPLMTQHCLDCHRAGGVAPFTLESLEQVKEASAAVRFAVESGSMPPLRTNPDCRSFTNDHFMPDTDRAALISWIDAGMPGGDASQAAPLPPVVSGIDHPDLVLQPAEAYLPVDGLDDYHCLPLEGDFSEATYVTAHEFVPDATELVHHAILYLVPPSGVAGMLAEDAAAEGPGYPCYGSSGHNGQPMGVWAPGGGVMRFPEGSAFEIPAGARIVAQMHYNTAAGEARPDQSTLRMTVAATAPPERVTMPIFNGFFEIPAGDANAVFSFEAEMPADMLPKRIVSVMPHMHRLGRQISLHLDGGDGEQCVSQITDWAFEWQQFYELQQSEQLALGPGDVLRYQCTFDNTAGTAPVAFGEGTDDEMCLHVVTMVGPPENGGQGPMCDPFDACYQACDTPGGDCFLDCMADNEASCSACLLEGTGDCTSDHCPVTGDEMFTCMSATCAVDFTDMAGILACLSGPCRPEFDANWACLTPHLESGACDTNYNGCAGWL